MMDAALQKKKNGAEVNRSDLVEEWTPLMKAAAEGNNEVVEILLEQGGKQAVRKGKWKAVRLDV